MKGLGSEAYRDREAATQRLLAATFDEAPPALLRAQKSPDAEVRRRAKLVAGSILRRAAARRVRRAAAAGTPDLLVDGQVSWPRDVNDADGWQATLDLAWAVIDKARGKAERHPRLLQLPGRDFRAYLDDCRPARVGPDEALPLDKERGPVGIVRAEVAKAPHGIAGSIVVSRGQVQLKREIASSIVLSNAGVRSSKVEHSVVVCDGDLEASYIRESIVIASGDIRLSRGMVLNSVVIAGGTVSGTKTGASVIKEKERHAFGFVRFFEPTRVGVEVVPAKGGVKVKEAAEGKPFAAAGVRKGDLILAVGGAKADTPEAFRRLLRRAVAEGEGVFRLRRGDDASEVKVTFKD